MLCALLPDDTPQTLAERFHATHAQAYTFRLDQTGIEITGLHLEATLNSETIKLLPVPVQGRGLEQSRKGTRAVYFQELGWTDCAVHDRNKLPVGPNFDGPLLIEEPTATTLVLPGQSASMTETGILLIREAGEHADGDRDQD